MHCLVLTALYFSRLCFRAVSRFWFELPLYAVSVVYCNFYLFLWLTDLFLPAQLWLPDQMKCRTFVAIHFRIPWEYVSIDWGLLDLGLLHYVHSYVEFQCMCLTRHLQVDVNMSLQLFGQFLD